MRQLRRAGVATVMAAAIAFSVTACGGDDGKDKPSGNSSTSSSQGGGQDKPGNTGPDTSKVIADVKGDSGIEMVIHQIQRDNGGFVTVNGEFKNPGSDSYTIPIQWSGEETAVAGTGRSIAAMTLVDSKGKKRYYVLRDTDNRPLATAGFDPSIEPNGSLTFYAQFPSPPSSTTSVDLEFPGFPNTTIGLS